MCGDDKDVVRRCRILSKRIVRLSVEAGTLTAAEKAGARQGAGKDAGATRRGAVQFTPRSHMQHPSRLRSSRPVGHPDVFVAVISVEVGSKPAPLKDARVRHPLLAG